MLLVTAMDRHRHGREAALRAPRTTSTAPDRIRASARDRSAAVRPGATSHPGAQPRSQPVRGLGVGAISGTMTMLARPRSRAAWMRRMYTSVFRSRDAVQEPGVIPVVHRTDEIRHRPVLLGGECGGLRDARVGCQSDLDALLGRSSPLSAMDLSVGMVVFARRQRSAAGIAPPPSRRTWATTPRRPATSAAGSRAIS